MDKIQLSIKFDDGMVNRPEPPSRPTQLGLVDLGHPTLTHYFETINAGAFQETAALFTPDGEMRAPFSEPIPQPAIAAYLEKEATGMALHPRQVEPVDRPADDPLSEYDIQVTGQVQTPLFSVNVAWLFALQQDAIRAVRIKLLASPQELLKLRR
ncbi:MAG: nuclear transport factor 2 family protein [Cyanobacteria bacterium P01_A01_bin.135]